LFYYTNILSVVQLNAWQEEIQSTNGLLAMNANRAIRGLTWSRCYKVSFSLPPRQSKLVRLSGKRDIYLERT
jgi:hypothetical protein